MNDQAPSRFMSRTSIIVGLTLVLLVVPLVWWPSIAERWLPSDLVLRNIAAQAMDWAFAILLMVFVLIFEKERLAALGFKSFDLDTLWAGLGLGGFFMLGSVAFLFVWPALGFETVERPGAPDDAYPPYFFFWYAPLALVTAAVAEEIIFRGYALERLLKLKINPVFAVILVQIAFAMYHVKDGLFSVVNVALVGSLFSIYYAKYRNLTMTIIAHAMVDSLAVLGRIAGIG